MFRVRDVYVAAIAVAFFSSVALAQPPGGVAPNRPVYSPYLNLVRRDAPAGINYYGLVRPQIAAQNNIQALQQQITLGQQQQLAAEQLAVTRELPITGQQTFFLNTGGYFQNNRGGAVPTNPSLTTRSAAPATQSPMRKR
jgi:hypothetical protein